jgi:hypothetical protein
MSAIRKFFTSPISRAFWAFGLLYTIVRYRHIGLDIATSGAVPALRHGLVVRVRRTEEMAWVVVIKWGPLYLSYCHLATTGRLPRVGDRVKQNEIIGDIATSSDPRSQWYGGTAWNGRHLHFVISTHPEGAFRKGTGSEYFDPKHVIRDTLDIPEVETIRVTTRTTRLFAAQSTKAPGFKNLPKDTRVVTVGAAVGGFYRVKYADGVAYILGSRLVKRTANVNAPKGLRYRSKPSTVSGKVLGLLKHDTPVVILGVNGTSATSSAGWARILVDGKSVWVARKFLA